MPKRCNISVIIVSHNRLSHLTKMLACLRLQDIAGFEVIVVSNTPLAPNSAILPQNLSEIRFDQANISMARNLGIEAAQGDFVAFCDDDALPDPGWLRHLMAPFADSAIGGASGFTRGRNGISKQWEAVLTDSLAAETAVTLSQTKGFEPGAPKVPVMIGTNCGFRKSALQHIGGFDPAFAYFLDDSDISWRLAQAGWHLVVVPECQVHHNFAKNAGRTARRIPTDLTMLGRSFAYFCRKHGDPSKLESAIGRFRAIQRRALEKLFLVGLLESAALTQLMQSLEAGFLAAKELDIKRDAKTCLPPSFHQPVFEITPQKHVVLAGQSKYAETLEKDALCLINNGYRVTVVDLSASPKFMQVEFSEGGFWRHSGGQFGKIDRKEPLWRWRALEQKYLLECNRLSKFRSIDFVALHRQKKADATIPPQKFGMCSLNDYKVLDDSKLWSNQGTNQ